MSNQTRSFTFWRSVGALKIGNVVTAWDFLTALAVSVVGTVLLAHHAPQASRHVNTANDFLSAGGALFGVVLGGFAIAAALLGDKYSRLLQASGGSALTMLRHFLIVGGLLIGSIVSTVLFRAAAEALASWSMGAEQIAFGFTAFLFFWSLFGCLELMKLVLAVASTSASFSALDQNNP